MESKIYISLDNSEILVKLAVNSSEFRLTIDQAELVAQTILKLIDDSKIYNQSKNGM